LEVYQETFPDFICESPTSTKALSQDEENEARLSGMAQKEVHAKEPQILKGGG
jgi:hypothetical protein